MKKPFHTPQFHQQFEAQKQRILAMPRHEQAEMAQHPRGFRILSRYLSIEVVNSLREDGKKN